MHFNYTYRITYGSGQCCDRSREQLTIEITREQYGRIIEKVIQGCTINEESDRDSDETYGANNSATK